MPQVKIIRAALREIQKLPYQTSEIVYQILRSLSQGNDTNTQHLTGYEHLRRTRKGDVRVIWKKDSNDILIIKVGHRRDVYRGELRKIDVDNYEFITEVFNEEIAHEEQLQKRELLNPQGKELAENPAYYWNFETDFDWYKFVYNSYRYSPILTNYQRNELKPLLSNENIYLENENRHFTIVQSAPGTGKTVCATLFACEKYREFWNTMLIVPEELRQDISAYSEVKQLLNQDNFWLGTFRQWLSKIAPELHNNLATAEQEFQALKDAGLWSRRKIEINKTDVLLYQSFVLDKEENSRHRKNPLFQYFKERITKLEERIKPQDFLKKLSAKKCRLQIAQKLKQNPPPFPANSKKTILIIDEAQDYLLSELQALITICQEWSLNHHPTYLWLLGDLNQRIEPTNFFWTGLDINQRPIELKINYRNSYHILKFANNFLQIAQKITSELKGKTLPQPPNPEDAFEIGEPVRLLKFSTQQEANNFLHELANQAEDTENQRYLLRNLANAVKVLTNNNHEEFNQYENLLILNAEKAKGREFEACVAFCLFAGTNEHEPTLQESFQWYTLLTRARSRLLVVVTEDELKRLAQIKQSHNYFAECEEVNVETAKNWILELASDVDLSQITSDVKERLLQRCQTDRGILLYWDTYLALELARLTENEIYQWEQEAIKLLKTHSLEDLNAEIQQPIQDISLRCLLLRSIDKSWQAVAEIRKSELKKNNLPAYQRLLSNIAQDLENKQLPYEAARVRTFLDDEYPPQNLPFWDEVNHPENSSQPLVTLLCQGFISRIDNLIAARRSNND
ncbi:MAG: hypothetical protein QNJ47_01335 [Nostocaceae cyanobacterium]|nr:hypothetical protein [Nostocaceae cyanobacterium]